jgi:hypothetical protein
MTDSLDPNTKWWQKLSHTNKKGGNLGDRSASNHFRDQLSSKSIDSGHSSLSGNSQQPYGSQSYVRVVVPRLKGDEDSGDRRRISSAVRLDSRGSPRGELVF